MELAFEKHQMGKRIQQESNGYHKEIKWIIENECIRITNCGLLS